MAAASTASSGLASLLSDTLQVHDGASVQTVPTAEHLAGKKWAALYFSAHWCGPCQRFTPKLAQCYEAMMSAGRTDSTIIFVSSDHDQSAFDGYFGSMPWAAVPYADRAVKDSLSKKFKVSGIPTLITFNVETGAVINASARGNVMTDPEGASFPWIPPTFEEVLGTEFVRKDGSVVTKADLSGKTLAIYFSAHWCPPCRAFTPKLVSVYEGLLAAGRTDFEFIFVSGDQSGAEFDEYLAEMPWAAVPFADESRRDALNQHFNVEGIPTLVTVTMEGKVINANARGGAMREDAISSFPWYPLPMVELSDDPSDINDFPAMVLFMERASDEEQAVMKAAMEPLASRLAEEAKATGERKAVFYTVCGESPVSGQIRTLTDLGDPSETPQLVIVDVSDAGSFYVSPATTINTDTITEFYEMFKIGALDKQQFHRG